MRENYINLSADLMRNPIEFESAMKRTVIEWPNSCEAALTASSINHQAWMGHAGCALNHGSPEDMTRLGWRTLTIDEQDAANLSADRAITFWREKYVPYSQNKKIG